MGYVHVVSIWWHVQFVVEFCMLVSADILASTACAHALRSQGSLFFCEVFLEGITTLSLSIHTCVPKDFKGHVEGNRIVPKLTLLWFCSFCNYYLHFYVWFVIS